MFKNTYIKHAKKISNTDLKICLINGNDYIKHENKEKKINKINRKAPNDKITIPSKSTFMFLMFSGISKPFSVTSKKSIKWNKKHAGVHYILHEKM